MANNIFVSYKYSDWHVAPLPGIPRTTARNYVDEIQKLLAAEDHIYMGENDGESLETLNDATIGSKLGDKIFYSSITIVLISKEMKLTYTAEREQWIPWEISYSLKEQSRQGRNSKTNAVLAVVLPDEFGSYEYFMTYSPTCNSTTLKTNTLFQILRENMFNIKDKETDTRECNGAKIYNSKNHSYIPCVKWEEFATGVQPHIDLAISIRQNINNYELVKTVK